MVLSELIEQTLEAANAEESDRHSPSMIRRLLNDAQSLIVRQSKLLISDPLNVMAGTTLEVTKVSGSHTATTGITLSSAKYLRVGDRIDFVYISGSSPDEATVREASYRRVQSIAYSTGLITLATVATVQDGDSVFWANDMGLINAEADETTYPAPWSSLEMLKVEYKDSASGEYVPLHQTSPRRVGRSQRVNSGLPSGHLASGWPTQWYPLGVRQFGVYPAPDSALTDGFRVTFVRQPRELIEQSDEPEIPEPYHSALWQYAAHILLKRDGNFEASAALKIDWQEYLGLGLMHSGGTPREPLTRGGS